MFSLPTWPEGALQAEGGRFYYSFAYVFKESVIVSGRVHRELEEVCLLDAHGIYLKKKSQK